MTNSEIGGIFAMIVITLTALVLLAVSPSIHAWEKANGYPYGKLCDLYQTCK